MVVFAREDYYVNFNPFDLNLSNVGNFKFALNGSLYSIEVTGGPKGHVGIKEVDTLLAPEKLESYRYYKAEKDGYIPNMKLVFAIPKNWLNIKHSDYSEIRVYMNTSGKWENVDKIKQYENSDKYLIRIEITKLGDLAIGIVKGAKICPKPTKWTECLRGNQTRIMHEIIDGVCIPHTEVKACPVELKASYNTLSTTLALLGLLVITPLVVYPIVKNRQVF